jgi:hypothetical protein
MAEPTRLTRTTLSRHSGRMTRHAYRQSIALCVLVGLLVLGSGCSSAESAGGFCDSTANALKKAVKDVMNHDHPFDRSAFIARLRAIDLSDLGDADQQAFTAAINEVESKLFARTGGWTTEPVATAARRLCTREMPVISIVP